MTLKKLQNIAEKLVKTYCKKHNLKSVNIKVKDLKTCGRFVFKTRFISIPLWAYIQGGIHYFTAYVLHEIVHVIRYDLYKDTTHGINFRRLEKKVLKMHGLVPVKYRRSFYNELEDVNGKTLWIASAKVKKVKGMKTYTIRK